MNEYEDEGLATPNLEKIGTKYQIDWEDGVRVTLDTPETERDRHVTAEILIQDFGELGGSYILQPQRYTLTRSPRGLITQLNGTSNREDWQQRLMQVSMMVLREHRRGEPIIDLNERTSPEIPPEMVTGICYEGTPTVLYGEGGIGKSMIGLSIATAIHNGIGINNSFEVKGGNAMILDYETSWEETYRRSRDIINGLEGATKHIYYRYCSQPLYQDVEQLRNRIAEYDIRFLLIDSAGPACGGEPENANATLKFFSALRALTDSEKPLTTLTLAHVTKNAMQVNNRNPFGSVYWVNMPRNTFELQKHQEKESNYMEVAMHHRKTNVGKLRDTVAFRVTWADRSINIEGIDIKESQLKGTLTVPKRVVMLFEDSTFSTSGLSTHEIAHELEHDNEGTLKSTLSRMDAVYSKPSIDNRMCGNCDRDLSGVPLWFPSF